MLRFLLILISAIAIDATTSYASMPFYDDDDEFRYCTKATNDWDTCAREESIRTLNTIKKQYRTILTTPSTVGWHENIQDNTNELRHMYESWTAFRNRLCSLSNKSALYLEKIIQEKISCNLYYTLHHKDHLDSIILLLRGEVPEKKINFDYLKIYDHDEQYSSCMEKQQAEECISQELKRSTREIKNLYKTMLEDEFVGKWNNGPDLKNGNYRDMFDSWIAYRNRMCSLSVWAYEKAYGKNTMSLNHCLQFFNREKLETMQNLLISAHSTLDEEMDTTDDDGGEAEGKTIIRLEKRLNDSSNRDDTLDEEEVKDVEKPIPEKTKQKKVNIPAWAQ